MIAGSLGIHRKERVVEKKEDDSETRAHYPIVGSALADGVYSGGDSKSWPILRWESALRSTLIRLERSCSASVSFPPARQGLFLVPLASRAAPSLLLPALLMASPSPYRSPDCLLMVHIDSTHTIKRERDDPLESDRPRSALALLLHVLACGTEPSRLRSRTLDPAASISTLRTLIRSEGNTRTRERGN